MTRDPAAILAAGFVNGDGTDGLGTGERIGVLLTSRPVLSAGGGQVLAVDLPDSIDLTDYELTAGSGRWCVPADVVNPAAQVRLLSRTEVDAATAAGTPRA